MRDGTGTEQVAETDEQLVERTRGGDRRAFAELWSRHYRSGITVARSFTNLDADDLVSESFTRIYQRTLDGGGPRGAFRPYLYTTIRNLACTWGTARAKSVNVDDVADFEPTESAEEPAARSLDRTLTVQAYRSLPSRWQTVLWYTEVEGLDPSDVAPILGMSANGVAALSYRAREGLRKAWLQAHVTDATASGDCAWVLDRVGERARKSLTARESRKLEAHLAICPKCSNVSQEVDDVGARLAMAMIPLLLGGIAGGGILAASLGSGTAAVAASAAGGAAVGGTAVAASAAPAAFGGATVTAAASGTAAATTGVLAVAASTVFVAAVSVGAVGIVQSNEAAVAAESSSSRAGALADPLGLDADDTSTDTGTASSAPVDPATIPDEVVPTPASTPVVPAPEPTSDVATDTDTDTGTDDTSTTDTSSTDTTTVVPSTDKKAATTDDAGKKATDAVKDTTKAVVPTSVPTATSVTGAVSDVVTGTTGTVDKVVTGTTGTVDSVVKGTTDVVDGVVDTVLPPGDGLVGSLNGTVDSVTGTVNGLTGTVTGTVNGTVGGVTGLVGGLVGGLVKP